jgi:hypothetical protein
VLGRPHGIWNAPLRDVGPLRPGTWIVALTAPGQPIEYQPPLQVESFGRYRIDDLDARPAALLQLRGIGDQALPPLRELWLCRDDAIVLLEPRRDLLADLRIAPGDYVLYWQREGAACSRIDVRARPGAQSVELGAMPGEGIEFVVDYRESVLSERIATFDLAVRDGHGRALWRERLLAPLADDGQLRLTRRFAVDVASFEAIDPRGYRGETAVARGQRSVTVIMQPPPR